MATDREIVGCTKTNDKFQHIKPLTRHCLNQTSIAFGEVHSFAAVLGWLRFLHFTPRRSLLVIEPTRNDVLRELAQSITLSLRNSCATSNLTRCRAACCWVRRRGEHLLYFIDSGVVSLVANTKSGHSVEVALVGREGVAGIAAMPWRSAPAVQPGRSASRSRISRPQN